MWTDIADWLKVNILNDPQVFKSILALIFMIAGLLLFAKRTTERNLLKNKRVWGTMLFICGLVVFLQANITDIADVFTVLATIVLAGVAVFSFEESRRLRKQYREREERDRKERLLREKRRREEELAKEKRDRDERFLNEIIEWGVESIKIGTPIESAVFVGKMEEEAERRLVLNSLASLRNDFTAMIAISLYVSKLGLTFGKKLQSSIDKLDEALREQEIIAIKCQRMVMEKKTNEFDDAWEELIDNWMTLSNSAVNVIDEAVIEKSNIHNA